MEEKQIRQVHESQEERQHVRVRLNGNLRLRLQSPVKGIFSLEDVSMGGLSFIAGQVDLPPGSLCHGEVVFRLGRANLSMPISFRIIYQDDSSKRTGGEFTVIDQENADLLRLLISNYLAGELTSLDDVIDNMKRENYVTARKGKQAAPARSLVERCKAVLISGVFFVLGLLAFVFVAYKLYQHAFMIKAADAWISLPGKTLIMPENGYVQMLIPEGTDAVEKGQPLMTISSRLVARLNNGVLLDSLDAKQVKGLLDAAVFEVTLNSPCDCTIAEQMVADGEYLHDESPLMRLVEKDAPARVVALFDLSAERLPGRADEAVTIQYLDGKKETAAEVVEMVRDEASGKLRMEIQPQRSLPLSAQHQPVSVMVHPAWLPVL
ncbi:MAG: alginate biosynthesis protein [Alcanivoracaceae bacterium]|nr:alginate biosynthesis protein [Alcanivoracaceae bacterium]MEE2871046.1 PilZ domain-containing protein [Pseudomonadota bacterium]|tara:strand:+ start:322 stop:1458 length:1137 start_codon:yes stop_codon:yes gene_type:complete